MLGGFWGPFRDNLAQVAGVAVTDIIDVLNDQLGAHFFPQQARVNVPMVSCSMFVYSVSACTPWSLHV